ncbi:hypothetical protein Trydic_g5185 [Trypoxylus dichotomus]
MEKSKVDGLASSDDLRAKLPVTQDAQDHQLIWKKAVENADIKGKLRNNYKFARNKVTMHIKQAKRKYYHDKFVKYDKNMKETWKCVNKVLGRSLSIQGRNIFERHMETTTKEIAEKFCETFTSAVSPGEHICQEQLYYNYMKRNGLRCRHIQKESIYIPDITDQELRSMIATMDIKMSPGYDKPISVLSSIDKIIEKYVAKVMHDYLQKYQILNESQYGYRNMEE